MSSTSSRRTQDRAPGRLGEVGRTGRDVGRTGRARESGGCPSRRRRATPHPRPSSAPAAQPPAQQPPRAAGTPQQPQRHRAATAAGRSNARRSAAASRRRAATARARRAARSRRRAAASRPRHASRARRQPHRRRPRSSNRRRPRSRRRRRHRRRATPPCRIAASGRRQRCRPRRAQAHRRQSQHHVSVRDADAGRVFRRADTVWMVFDTDGHGRDLGAERGAGQGHPQRDGDSACATSRWCASSSNGRGWSAWRPRTTAGWSRSATRWSSRRGRSASAAISSRPARSSITIPIDEPRNLHRLEDPDVGDLLLGGHGGRAGARLHQVQDFVEFRALASAHGIAVQPLADDLSAELRPTRS